MADDKPPPEWTKVTLPLPASHQWKAKAGYQIFVGDGGAVRLDFPQGWVVRHEKKDTITFHDRPPPKDTARISLTVFHLPPMAKDWRKELPLEDLIRQAFKAKDGDDVQGDIHLTHRPDVELGWAEKLPWKDPENGKMIRCRQVLARSRRVQALMTFDFYVDSGDKYLPVWDHLLRSIRLETPVNLDGTGKN